MGVQESHDEQARRIGKDYWQNKAVITQANNSEKFGLNSPENNPALGKNRQPKQNKSDHECFASYTFNSFNKALIIAYESRHPQPKEWKVKRR